MVSPDVNDVQRLARVFRGYSWTRLAVRLKNEHLTVNEIWKILLFLLCPGAGIISKKISYTSDPMVRLLVRFLTRTSDFPSFARSDSFCFSIFGIPLAILWIRGTCPDLSFTGTHHKVLIFLMSRARFLYTKHTPNSVHCAYYGCEKENPSNVFLKIFLARTEWNDNFYLALTWKVKKQAEMIVYSNYLVAPFFHSCSENPIPLKTQLKNEFWFSPETFRGSCLKKFCDSRKKLGFYS